MPPDHATRPRVGLFATCLMNLFRPNVGFAAARLLEDAGCEVEVPLAQTCCGQPGYNSGDFEAARALARQVIETFEGFDYVVGPSGSCMATLRHDYPKLLADDPAWRARAEALAARSHELLSFLTDVRGVHGVAAHYAGTVTYHDSCSSLRGLGVEARRQPRPGGLRGQVGGGEDRVTPTGRRHGVILDRPVARSRSRRRTSNRLGDGLHRRRAGS